MRRSSASSGRPSLALRVKNVDPNSKQRTRQSSGKFLTVCKSYDYIHAYILIINSMCCTRLLMVVENIC